MPAIKDNLRRIGDRLTAATRRAGRQPDSVKLVAVSKRIPRHLIREAADCGQFLFGENYIQEAAGKIKDLGAGEAGPDLAWHFIGHLQSNKAGQAAELFRVIETVDRFKLARELDKHLVKLGRDMDILIQVNIGREPQKSGILPEKCAELLEQLAPLKRLRVQGLMTMPPFRANPEDSRPCFRQLRELAVALQARTLLPSAGEPELSMGMSNDFEVAIEEGATLVRIGTAIFGPRA